MKLCITRYGNKAYSPPSLVEKNLQLSGFQRLQSATKSYTTRPYFPRITHNPQFLWDLFLDYSVQPGRITLNIQQLVFDVNGHITDQKQDRTEEDIKEWVGEERINPERNVLKMNCFLGLWHDHDHHEAHLAKSKAQFLT